MSITIATIIIIVVAIAAFFGGVKVGGNMVGKTLLETLHRALLRSDLSSEQITDLIGKMDEEAKVL